MIGIQRSLPQVGELLKNRIFRRKVKQISVKAEIEAHETFKTKVLEPLLEQTQDSYNPIILKTAPTTLVLYF